MRRFESQHDRDLEIIGCPDCGAPAEIVWRTELASTDGQIEHLDVRCVRRHSFFMPSEHLEAS
jgi:hypothetical protein